MSNPLDYHWWRSVFTLTLVAWLFLLAFPFVVAFALVKWLDESTHRDEQ